MKRIVTAALALVTLSALGQETFDARIRVERADGTEVVIPATPQPTGNYIVEFRDAPLAVAMSSGVKAASVAQYQATFTRFRADLRSLAATAEVRWEYFRVLNGVSVRAPEDAIAAIARLPYVSRISIDEEMHTMAGPAVGQIGADKVWATLGSRGKGVVVAVIDTGVDYNHEALGRGFGPGHKVIGGFDFANRDADPMDDNGHGTHVSGIIAGDSLQITGVAPEASIIAYKVLRSTGSGSTSDVIAAIERTVDPNGDGNTSDHVDVANLSLGGTGSPDDAGSRAIDNATLAGVVFCVAAGNSGKYHSVSSPGTARRAITVGAVDGNDLLASFSSRGPTPKDLTMKPEVGAPGVSIFSSLPGNQYGAESGTSMATPHVAGACALLKALHPDWSPAEIKTAVMINAANNSQEAMGSGAGRLDVLAAAKMPLTVETSSIDFGLDPIARSKWSQSATLRVTNRADHALTVGSSVSPVTGVAASVTPSQRTIDPGQSADFTLAIDVDNAIATVSQKSFSGGSYVTLTSDAGTVRVPWSFVKAVRSIAAWDKQVASFVWFDAGHTVVFDSTALASNASETLLASPGKYDLVVYGSTLDSRGTLTRASFIYLEAQQLDGDTSIAATEAQASHTIRTNTLTAEGRPMLNATDQSYGLGGRLLWPPGGSPSAFRSLSIPPLTLHELHVNDIADHNGVIINEVFFDFSHNGLYALQHPMLLGVANDAALTATNMRSADVQLLMTASADNRLLTQVFSADGLSFASLTRSFAETFWNGRLYLSDGEPPYVPAVNFTVIAEGSATQYQTPTLRASAGQIGSSSPAQPYLYNGGRWLFGAGPRFATMSFGNVTSILRPTLSIDLLGALGEARLAERARTAVATYGSDGKLRANVIRYPTPLDFSVKGRYTVEAINDATQYPDLPVEMKLTLNLDSNRSDYIPPTVTTLIVLDEAGRPVRALTPHGGGTLYFSAADYAYGTAKTYNPVRSETTKVWYRYAGAESWTPLTVTQAGEDAGGEGRLGTGVVFHVDLTPVANIQWGRVDLKIDLSDVAGNTTSMVMQPAFSVGGEYPPRRRAERP